MRVVLLCPPGPLASLIVRTLHASEIEVSLICEARSSIRYSFYGSEVLLCRPNVFDAADAIRIAINNAHARRAIDVVMASDVPGLEVLALIKDDLKPAVYPMPGLSTLNCLGDKWQFTKLCASLDIPVPRTLFFETPAQIDFQAIKDDIQYPCVIKALAKSGSLGVHVVDGPVALVGWLKRESAYFEQGVLIQAFVAGTDLGIGVFAQDGLIKNWTTFRAIGKLSTEFTNLPPLLEYTERLLSATNYTGVANFDARLDVKTNTIKMFECNPRFFRRIREIEKFGLNFIETGLHSLNLANAQPECLTSGRHINLADLVTKSGITAVLKGYDLGMIGIDVKELLCDPIPRAIPFVRNLSRSVLGKSIKGGV